MRRPPRPPSSLRAFNGRGPTGGIKSGNPPPGVEAQVTGSGPAMTRRAVHRSLLRPFSTTYRPACPHPDRADSHRQREHLRKIVRSTGRRLETFGSRGGQLTNRRTPRREERTRLFHKPRNTGAAELSRSRPFGLVADQYPASSGMGKSRPSTLFFKYPGEFRDARLSGMNTAAGRLLRRYAKNARQCFVKEGKSPIANCLHGPRSGSRQAAQPMALHHCQPWRDPA